ncbi:MAG: hypothetical protein BroJett011_42660 [Chloroflexota bacterium]|nr:MAG: hypothetical protein BroJett011_42660 [Chloroflexota bacterium]
MGQPFVVDGVATPLNSAAPKRVFIYNNKHYEDPGAHFTIEQVRASMAQLFPEVENASWNINMASDGTQEITFVKVTGEKGATVTPQQVINAVVVISPTQVHAVNLLHSLAQMDLSGQLGGATLLRLAPEIEGALAQAEEIAQGSQKVLTRCLALKSVPAFQIPIGF